MSWDSQNKFVVSSIGVSTDFELNDEELNFAGLLKSEMLGDCYSCFNCCFCIPPLCIYSLIMSRLNSSKLDSTVKAHPQFQVVYNTTCCLVTAIHIPCTRKSPVKLATSAYNDKGTNVQLRAHTAHGAVVDARCVFSKDEIKDINKILSFMNTQDNSAKKEGAKLNDANYSKLKKSMPSIVRESASLGRYSSIHYLAKEHPVISIDDLRCAIQKNAPVVNVDNVILNPI